MTLIKENEISIELKKVLDELAFKSSRSLTSILQQFRDICTSDEDYSRRMWCEQRMGVPHKVQYIFDGKPVFYTTFEIKYNRAEYKICQGSMYDNK
jgi:hypothetical protein